MLALFNVTVLMNYHDMIWKRPVIIAIVFILSGMAFLDFRNWWAGVAVIFVNFAAHLHKFPRLANHSNIEMFICLLLLVLFILKIRNPKFHVPPLLISNLFRVTLVTIYFYTGFHKLNTDFFNPCVSCVNGINEQFFKNFTGITIHLDDNASVFFQYATIVIEMMLPFGLFWRRTRTVTALLLLGFHAYLGFTVFSDFQALAIFMIIGCVLDFEKKELSPKLLWALRVYIFMAMCAVFVKPFMFKLFRDDSNFVNFIHGNIFNIAVIVFLVAFFRNSKTVSGRLPGKYYVFPLSAVFLISCWSMKGYFGFGNSANLTMFSNIVTESTRSNHLLIDTKKTKITDLEENTVLILDLHDTLKYYKLEGYRLPMTEFHYNAASFIKHHPTLKLNCTIVYKNDTIVIPDIKKTGYVQTKWWYHYINFRKIQPEGPNECLW